ncbi:MAG: translation initiation factor IF-2 [Lachnospiraceae bacterium]|nr:translation initiation factor IF-2 [Lachnospiraceae bacterium]
MATKMKVYEIAKSLNRPSKDLVKALNENGFEVKSHNSNIEDAAIAFILKNFNPLKENEEEVKENVETKVVKEQPEKDIKEPDKKKEKEMVQEVKQEKEHTEQKVQDVKQNAEKEEKKKDEVPEEKVEKNKQEQVNKQEKTEEKKEMKKEKMNKGNQENKNQENRKQNNQNESKERKNEQRNDQNNGQRRDNNHQTRNNNDNRNRNGNRQGTDRNDRNNRDGDRNNRGGDRNNRSGGNRNFDRNNNDRNNNRRNDNNQRDNRNDRNGFKRNNDRNGNNRNGNNRDGFHSDPFMSVVFDKPTEKSGGRNNAQRNGNGYNNKKKNNRRDIDDELPMEKPKKDPNRKGAFIMPKPVVVEQEDENTIKTVILPESMTIKELADKMKVQPANIVKKLFLQGKIVTINQEVTFEEAEEIALEYNYIAELEEQVDIIEELLKEEEEDESKMKKRPPVICVMGHVDHGKTSLLDAIRKTNVTEREAGGITQHIGAYMVSVNGEKITFLDTPGHEAFTSMRMRGAQSTDIAILVVAADDGVMPQTVEAISHAKAAGVEIIVAVNKIDKESANIERVKQELVEHELIAEDWGGTTAFVPVSARSGQGIEELLEMILLTAEVMELKANPNRAARGIVIEAQLDKGRGPVATVLVQKGTLHVGDSIAVGKAHGKVRAMIDDKGRRVKEATPSTPVEILGLNEVPEAGEIFINTENDKEARNIAEAFIKQGREKLLADTKARLSLDGLFSQIQAGNIKELNLIVKADVQGSVEAVKQSLLKLSNEEVAIRIIHGGVGAINESDVSLASASNAIIIGFNVRPDATAKDMADTENVDLRLYKVIYNAIEDVEAAMKGMLDPIFEEKVIGHAEVRQTFKASGVGVIAGSYVLDGKIVRNSKVRIRRDGELIHEGELASLKRFKDDVKEVNAGYECGLVFEKYNDIKEEDQVEIYVMEEVPR